jgi:uracil-DNA glycosylase
VIECGHPSPLSVRHWMGCKTFSKCNAALAHRGKAPIDWALPESI